MRFFLLAIAFAQTLPACECQTSFRPCNETGASDLVFAGRVTSITPLFLNRWNRGRGSSLRELNDLYLAAQDHPSDAAYSRLKDGYTKLFPDMTPDLLHELQAAKDLAAISSVFYSTLSRGSRVHFRVDTLYRHEKDDDVKDSDDDEAEFDVWTPFNDCGIDFQAGETYLVYANNDEGSGVYTATRCTRTRRLTDASEDLGYLFFYKERPEESSRVEGFATSDRGYQLNLSKMRDPESVGRPEAGLVIQLESDQLVRFTSTAANGRFIFDGLPEGKYRISAYSPEYPEKTQLLAGPDSFQLAEQACGLRYLLIRKP